MQTRHDTITRNLFSLALCGALLTACDGDGDSNGSDGTGTSSDGADGTADDTGGGGDDGTTGDGDTGGGSTGTDDGGSGTSDGGTDTGDTGTGTGDTGSDSGGLEIAGSWIDDYGMAHEITESAWSQESTGFSALFHVESFDNDADFLVAQNDAANDYNADLFSRFDWVEDGDGQLWYCQGVFDAATAADAESAPAPDRADPATTGCGGFPWSKLDPG